MTVFTVSNTADSGAATAGDGSLRGEILASNASTSALPNVINFALPAGLQTITAIAPLPTITEPTLIDGSSATGFTTKPLIQINGNNLTAGPAFATNSTGVTIQDFIINGFQGDGIDLAGVGGDTVNGCWIGVNAAGTGLASNTGTGILITSPNNLIGVGASIPNVISGNNQGIQISGGNATGNTVANSYIGTNAAGTAALGNTNYGIVVNTANNTIGSPTGGSSLGTGNLISGNLAGVQISGAAARRNLVVGNFIGTDVTGLLKISNANDGVDIVDTTGNTIGGTTTSAGNVISGNGAIGVQISGGTSSANLIEGNKIGVGSNGSTALGNGTSGVVINGSSLNYVGNVIQNGNSPGNIIAFNGTNATTNYGVEVLSGTGDAILSNSIYSNGGLGIKLNKANQGVSPPVLSVSESGAGQTKITGTYIGSPNEPYFLQFFSSPIQNASGFGDGKNYVGSLNVTTNSQGIVNFVALFNQAVPVGAYVSSTATDSVTLVNNTSQFSSNVQNIQAPVTDLSVATSVDPTNPPLFDQPYVYTVTITNNGPNDDTGVVLTDVLPTTGTFNSATTNGSSVGTVSAGVLTDDIGNLTSGSSVVVTITVTPNSLSGTFSNTASVTGDGLDPNLNNNSVTTTGTVAADSDLAVLITPSTTTVPLGTPLTYAVTVSNYGPNVADATQTVITLPGSFSTVSVAPLDQGTYTIDTSNPALTTITVNTPLLGVSQSTTILITATPTATGNPSVSATATSVLIDPNTGNNTATDTSVTVALAADLGISLDANPTPAVLGSELLYTLTITNNGPSAASGAQVVDTLPANVTYDAADSTPGLIYDAAAGTVTANSALLGGISPNTTQTLTIAVTPTSALQPITDTATISNSVEIDPNTANNTATFTSEVSPVDLSVNVLNPADPLFIGQQAVFQILVSNGGPADATNVLLTDLFGPGATIISTSAGSFSGSTITANLGTIVSGGSITVDVTVDPTASVNLTNSATVTSDNFDSNPNNNTSFSSNVVSPVNLGITASASASSILTGQPLTYTFTVTNAGPASATNMLFNDTLPTGLTLGSYTTSQGSIQPVYSGTTLTGFTGNLGTLASGGSATITITVTPGTVETAVNTATVTSDNIESDSSNNTVTTTVSAINTPGTIQFASNLELIAENAGSVTLTLTRTDGTLGAVSVDYATSDYTAIAGVNYIASSGTVSFADGQTTATITIPVLDDGIVNGNYGFFVTLSNPGGNALIGTTSVSGVLVTNTDRDTVPPVVSSLIAIPNGKYLNGFIVTFDKQMDLARISDLSNYQVFVIGTNGGQTRVPLAPVEYNLTTHAVTIVPTSPLLANRFYRVVVNGSVGDVLTDTSGNILFGSDGPNTNYDVIYGQSSSLSYDDSRGNLVSIKLSGGGNLGIFLAPNGNAEAINLYNVVPGKSKLTGSVKKLSKKASGFTTIGFINGFGEFGNVYSTLTTPSFYVGSAPVGIASVSSSSSNNTVNVLSLSSTKTSKTVTVGSKTPKASKVTIG